jgi:hypothetical protein
MEVLLSYNTVRNLTSVILTAASAFQNLFVHLPLSKLNTMTLTKFNALPIHQRSDMLWEWAYYITSIRTEKTNIIIFSMEDFFIKAEIALNGNKTLTIEAVTLEELEDQRMKIMVTDPFKARLVSQKIKAAQAA